MATTDNFKWEVESAASTLIEQIQVRNRMKSEPKFKKAVKAKLAERLKETQSAVTAAKEAVKKT